MGTGYDIPTKCYLFFHLGSTFVNHGRVTTVVLTDLHGLISVCVCGVESYFSPLPSSFGGGEHTGPNR